MILPHFNRITGREKSTNNYFIVTQTSVKQLKQGNRIDYSHNRPILQCVVIIYALQYRPIVAIVDSVALL